MHAWLPRLAKVRLPEVSHGTGWAVGDHGVLTAAAVVATLAEGEAEITLAASPDRSFAATVRWSSDSLALLEIAERSRLSWRTLLRSAPQPLLAHPRAEDLPGTEVTGVAAAASTSAAWILAPAENAVGVIESDKADGEPGVIELDRSGLSKQAMKHGLVGAALTCAESEPMLWGIVTGRVRARRRMRLEFATLPDPTTDDAFRAALVAVGAEPVVYNMDGPLLRQFVTEASLTESLHPRRVSEATGPEWFGTRRARSDVATSAAPFGPYVTRPERAQLAETIRRAVAGDGPRFIVVRGPSAAGKSRLIAETLAAQPGLGEYRILVPRRDSSVLEIPPRLRPDNVIFFLDDVDTYPAVSLRHDAVRADLATHPGTIYLVTVTDPPDPAHGLRLIDRAAARPATTPGLPLITAGLSPVSCLIDDDTMTTTVAVAARPSWSPRGSDEDVAVRALTAAARAGVGLGEYLSGYHDLAGHYTAALWPTRVLVEMVADWARSGIGAPMPEEAARRLWEQLLPASLPRDEMLRISRLSTTEMNRQWTGALSYACQTVVGVGALVRHEVGGLVASEFSRVHVDRGAISAPVWEYLLGKYPTTPAMRLEMGIRALDSGTPQRALRALESILFFRDTDPAARDRLIEVIARRGIAAYHALSGRGEQAVMVYTDLIDTFGADTDADICEQVAQALLGIGLVFSSLGSDGQAVSAYTELTTRYGAHPSPVLDGYIAKGLLGQATTLGQLGRHEEEASAYRDILARYGDRPVGEHTAAIVDVARAALGASDADG